MRSVGNDFLIAGHWRDTFSSHKKKQVMFSRYFRPGEIVFLRIGTADGAWDGLVTCNLAMRRKF